MAETLYLGTATLPGAWMALAVLEQLSVHFEKHQLTPYASYFPPWAIIFVAPVFLYCHNKHYWLRKHRVYGTKPAAVYAHSEPIFGLDWLLEMINAIKVNNVLQVWHSAFSRVGSNTFWHLATGRWIIFTCEPENLKAILATRFDDWPIGGVRQKSTEITLGPHSIFSSNGKQWQTARALIRPSFTRNQLADLKCQDRHVERFLAKIPRDGSVVEMQNLLYCFTMDSATDFMFGYSTDTLVKPTEETLEFTRSFDYMLHTSTSRGRLGWLIFLLPSKQLDKSVATCKRFIDRYVSQAISDSKIKERPYLFLNELLDSGASQEQIRDQLLSMIVGGRDTTASTLSSVFWILARRPDLYQKARNEISVLEGQKPTWEDLKSFKYINMILKETLRLYPAVATSLRRAARDTVLPKGGGPDGQSPLFVPKGTECRWSLYSLHRRRDTYGEDAEEFRPERWESIRTSWDYMAFSGGPRICIGQQFALTQMAYVMTRVLQTFEALEPCDDRPMMHKVSASSSLANGCSVRFTPA